MVSVFQCIYPMGPKQVLDTYLLPLLHSERVEQFGADLKIWSGVKRTHLFSRSAAASAMARAFIDAELYITEKVVTAQSS